MFLFTTVGASDHNWNANSYLALTSASSAAQCAVDQLLPICSGLPVAVTGQSTNGLGINPILPKFPSATVTSLENLFSTSPSTSSSWVTWLSEQPNPEQSDELWPVDVGTGNDQGVLDALIPFSAQSNGFPATTVAAFDSDNGSVAPLPSDWIYPASNLNGFQVPTAELQNAAGDFVAGTPASAQAALSDASVNATTNLVTFPTNDANPASYPMVDMSYLIVPTSGLSSAKDTALGKLIQFILGAAGATDISAAGAAPITKSADPQLYAADESVASDLIALGSKPATVTTSATASNTSSTSTSTTTTTVVAAAATSPTTTTIASGTVTPASAPKGAVPMGFASATSDLVSATDGTVEAGMSDLRVDVDVPAGEFATPTQITLSSGPTTAIKLPTGESAVAAVSIAIDQGGTKFAGTFASPVPVTIESLKLAKGAKLFLYNPATKAYVASATGSTISHVVASVGSVTFDLTGDPQFVIAEPASAPAARAPASKTPKAAPTVTTTTAAPVVTSSGGSSGSGGGSAGSGGVLAFTGISTIPVLLGASVLVLGAEGLRRRQLRSVRAARNTSRGNRR
jgi:hypothetical protein